MWRWLFGAPRRDLDPPPSPEEYTPSVSTYIVEEGPPFLVTLYSLPNGDTVLVTRVFDAVGASGVPTT